MISGSALAVVGGLLGLLLFWIVYSVRRHPTVDRGDGLGRVVIDPPRPTRLIRVAVFLATMVVYAVAVVAARVQIATIYVSAVMRMVLWILPAPTLVAPYANRFETGYRMMIAGSIVALALVIRAGPARRLSVALHAVVYLVMAALLDCIVVVTSAVTRLPIAYVGVEGIVLNMLLWAMVMLRVFFTTFTLPRPSRVVAPRGGYWAETLQTAALAVAVLGTLGLTIALVIQLGSFGHEVYILLGFMTYALFWTLLIVLFRIIGRMRRRPSTGRAGTPPIHVIMCAFNESPGIVDTLESVDRAAAHYAGKVRVTLADDGSEDDTVAISRATMDRFRAASGEIIACSHAGKSAALNAALARVTAPIAVRIDADVLISANAFACLPRWFADPTVGSVGGSTFPRMSRSWLHRMRLIECIYGYLFVRPGLVAVDALPCVPGTFQAFRPEPARAVGGMVMGMNGEDADLTLQLGRLGYRAVMDREIVIHEDVPTSLAAYREQRLRWYRSGAHLFARHNPIQARSAGPRVWLSLMRAAIFRFMMLVRPIVYLYAAVWALGQPSGTRNIWFVFVLFGSAVAPMLLSTAVEAVAHGYAGYLPWLLLWYPTYVLLRRVIMIESFLTLPTRPVVVPWPARAGGAYREMQPDAVG
ncbi:MAG TPA: glycosyltransferase [Candidatus Binatia bacterium]|nr:glycosyltransferase [Candidatus Binatia bacterium]